MQDTIVSRFDTARAVVLEAGRLAQRHFADIAALTVKSKGAHDMASEADLEVEVLIRDRLLAAFPDDAFFGEETGPGAIEGRRGLWVVDPIDGTQPFLSGIATWCVSVAFVLDGQLQFGLVYNPPLDEFFAGGRGIPATLNGRPIGPHPGLDLKSGVVGIGYSPRSSPYFLFASLAKLLEGGGMFFRNGSGALSLCYVACGRLLGHVEPHINAWDCLGAIAIIDAAGGRTSDFLVGDALLKGNRLVAAAPAVYEQVAALMN